jgi:hypothetical protein
MDAALNRVLGCGGKWYRVRRFKVVALELQAVPVVVVHSVNVEAVRTRPRLLSPVLDECPGLLVMDDEFFSDLDFHA